MELASAFEGDALPLNIGSYCFNENYDIGVDTGSLEYGGVKNNSMSNAANSRTGKELLGLSQQREQFASITPKIAIATQLSGKFFVAEYPIAGLPTGPSKAVELTCYRRNLFNVYGTVLIPEHFSLFVGTDGEERRITSLSAELQASESLHGRPVKIVTIPSRQPSNVEVVASSVEPGSTTLITELNMAQTLRPSRIAISWNRLQFRNATAKNSRRATLQQVYRLNVVVVALLEDGSTATIARAISTPIVVRGSSPGSFQPRRDSVLQHSVQAAGYHLESSKSRAEKHKQLQIQVPKTPTGFDSSFEKQEIRNLRFHEGQNDYLQADSADLYINTRLNSSSRSASMNVNSLQPNDSGIYETQIPRSESPHSDHAAADDTAVDDTQESLPEDHMPTYEYYPLSIDDWTVPIEAIYRPHYIHQQEIEFNRVQNSGGKRFYKR